MLVMILLVNFVASNDRLFHERMRMEHLMKEKQYEKALEVGEKSLKTDSSLTMLRIACLNETGEAGQPSLYLSAGRWKQGDDAG